MRCYFNSFTGKLDHQFKPETGPGPHLDQPVIQSIESFVNNLLIKITFQY